MVSDEDMAIAAADGDRQAFSTLLSRHYDRIHRVALQMTGNQAEAEDLTQDICLALPGKLNGFQGRSRFTTWLYRVTINAAHDRRRRAATHSKAAEGWGDWELSRRASIEESQESTNWLNTAMQSLPQDLRDTVALIIGEEITQKEAARILDISEGTIAWRMSEVKKHLRAQFDKEAEQ